MNPAQARRRGVVPTSDQDAIAASSPTRSTGFARYAWAVLAFNLFVILWGAYVRASGSGAGCGNHWPLCNGEIVPRVPALATLIELTHRLTSGVALLLVVGLVFAARRGFPPRDRVRRAAGWSAFFIATEALLGAGLVLLEYVADDKRAARGLWVAGHLANTYLLVAALALTAWWATNGGRRRERVGGATRVALAAALVAMLVLGTSGAITALGDTLFPASSWAEGKAQTFSANAHLFVRLRLWHPTLAIVVGLAGAAAVAAACRERSTAEVRRLGGALLGLYVAQLGLGLLNMRLLAPIELQMAHLLLADLCWIALVLLTAAVIVPAAKASPLAQPSSSATGSAPCDAATG